MTEDTKAAKQRRLAEALRANLRRRKSAAKSVALKATTARSEDTIGAPDGAYDASSRDRGSRG